MKRSLLVLPILLLSACANKPPKHIVIVPAVVPSRPVGELSSVRRAEEVREYRLGRYVDPSSRLVMHESHPAYRIERTASWNLRPSSTGATTRASVNAPATTAMPNDAVVAEINKQKAATKTFTEQTATLNQRLAGLADAFSQAQRLAEQQLLQQRDLAALKSRLSALEKERAAPPASTANQPPAATAEEPW